MAAARTTKLQTAPTSAIHCGDSRAPCHITFEKLDSAAVGMFNESSGWLAVSQRVAAEFIAKVSVHALDE
jgi:hypothetical protein